MAKTSDPQTDLSTYDNSWYQPGGTLKRYIWFILSRLFIHTYLPFPVGFKCLVLKIFGAKIGKNVMIKPKVNIKYPWFLDVGENTWIGENVWIDNLAHVRIGANCCLSQGALLLTGNHNYKSTRFDLKVSPITLEDGVWIGARAVVGPGVTCGSHAVLSVQSVASKDLDSYWVYGGNPAQCIRKREFDIEN
jgi:putative colanic acid biosynthesis acetyltransferase WcaF